MELTHEKAKSFAMFLKSKKLLDEKHTQKDRLGEIKRLTVEVVKNDIKSKANLSEKEKEQLTTATLDNLTTQSISIQNGEIKTTSKLEEFIMNVDKEYQKLLEKEQGKENKQQEKLEELAEKQKETKPTEPEAPPFKLTIKSRDILERVGDAKGEEAKRIIYDYLCEAFTAAGAQNLIDKSCSGVVNSNTNQRAETLGLTHVEALTVFFYERVVMKRSFDQFQEEARSTSKTKGRLLESGILQDKKENHEKGSSHVEETTISSDGNEIQLGEQAACVSDNLFEAIGMENNLLNEQALQAQAMVKTTNDVTTNQ